MKQSNNNAKSWRKFYHAMTDPNGVTRMARLNSVPKAGRRFELQKIAQQIVDREFP